QVENEFFRIPIQFLAAHSSYFRDLAGNPKAGLTEEDPINLGGVSREDFCQLLRILYSSLIRRNFNKTEPETLSFSQWEAVFRLAKRWEMDEVKTHAITAVEGLPNVDPVEKIILARTYDIRSWLAPSFNEILQRSQSLTESNIEKLGIPTVARLIGLRDRLRPSQSRTGGWTLGDVRVGTDIDFSSVIWDAFPDSRSDEMCEWPFARNRTSSTSVEDRNSRAPSPARSCPSVRSCSPVFSFPPALSIPPVAATNSACGGSVKKARRNK
ncbi:hypothetical protein FB446DRAFT_640467, partial [Lentinula raphanica]